MKLLNKNAIITGGSRGIGGAISKLFAKEGANISYCHFNDEKNANETKNFIESLGRKCLSLNLDISTKKNCDLLVSKTIEEIGSPDILVNNAGIIYVRPFEQATEEEFDKTINVHLKSTFFITQNCYKEMLKKKIW